MLTEATETREITKRPFTVELPDDLLDDLEAIAKWRGVSVDAIINWILSESRPMLLKRKAEQEEATLQMAWARNWANATTPEEGRQVLGELLARLQAEYDAMPEVEPLPPKG